MRWDDIRQLANLIEAEAAGRQVDRDLVVSLARQVALHHPQIKNSMGLVVERMSVRSTNQ